MQTLKKILIVDDVVNNRFLINRILQKKHLKTCEAANGFECIQYLEEDSEVSLIFMDIEMPKMDGIQATRVIKERWPDVKVVFQTSCMTYENINKIKEIGNYRILEKPLMADDIKECIDSLE